MFSAEAARTIAAALQRSHSAFNRARFLRGIEDDLEPLELKARMVCLADRLEANLPQSPSQLFPILTNALAQGPEDTVGLKSFLVWPLTEIVARRGAEDFTLSMHTLAEMTQRFTAEFAIRPFLHHEQERTLRQLLEWTRHDNEHVRRLASEGSRPLLPWGQRLPRLLQNPTLTTPLLDNLHQDPSEYVRRSVANHLNDFSKAHPAHVIATLRRWSDLQHPTLPSTINRAARTLIKQGHPDALALVGFQASDSLQLASFHIRSAKIPMGGSLHYSIEIHNRGEREQAVLFDYAIYHRKANGQLTRKVFKGKKGTIAAGEIWHIEGKHSFKPITTRTYYSGEHRIEPLLNGVACTPLSFKLG